MFIYEPERWLTAGLTSCHLECYRGSLQYDVREAFENLKLHNENINYDNVKEFSELLQQAIDKFSTTAV